MTNTEDLGDTGGVNALQQPGTSGVSTLAYLRSRRAEIVKVARSRGASEIMVFGSVARGAATPTSDVDLLVSFEPGRSLLDLGGLIADLEDLLGRSVDVVTADELRPHVRDRVLADAVAL
jgi:predicted nucleotidyltransferase